MEGAINETTIIDLPNEILLEILKYIGFSECQIPSFKMRELVSHCPYYKSRNRFKLNCTEDDEWDGPIWVPKKESMRNMLRFGMTCKRVHELSASELIWNEVYFEIPEDETELGRIKKNKIPYFKFVTAVSLSSVSLLDSIKLFPNLIAFETENKLDEEQSKQLSESCIHLEGLCAYSVQGLSKFNGLRALRLVRMAEKFMLRDLQHLKIIKAVSAFSDGFLNEPNLQADLKSLSLCN